MTITWTPIRVLDATSHGWRNISVRVAGGGIGKTYSQNPTVPAARPVDSTR